MTMRQALDLSAYLVVGPENTLGRPVRDIVAAAVEAGFTCVQIRSKEASARELMVCVQEAAAVIAKAGKEDQVALLVDDRLDIVLATRQEKIKVDGIHVGQSDIPPDICRRILGEDAIVGLSARSHDLLHYVAHANITDIDYFGAGPLHETATKPDCGRDEDGNIITRSLTELTQLAQMSPIPVVVGGGVKLSDIPALSATGVDGFFVVSAVAEAEVPKEAAASLVRAWQKNHRG